MIYVNNDGNSLWTFQVLKYSSKLNTGISLLTDTFKFSFNTPVGQVKSETSNVLNASDTREILENGNQLNLLEVFPIFIEHNNFINTKNNTCTGNLSSQICAEFRGLSVIQDRTRDSHTDCGSSTCERHPHRITAPCTGRPTPVWSI